MSNDSREPKELFTYEHNGWEIIMHEFGTYDHEAEISKGEFYRYCKPNKTGKDYKYYLTKEEWLPIIKETCDHFDKINKESENE